ncbi:hypothetical protein [Micromonospora sp. NPDC126480]|uniref:hypothetical protein n=1 Tax=Micromonospora sp. NPDC126480 TaxID=3155312 RepID=UPI00331F026A
MSHHEEQKDEPGGHLAALGQPPGGRDTLPEPDFANEHDRTAVDRDIITGDEDEEEHEEESPRGWSGEES